MSFYPNSTSSILNFSSESTEKSRWSPVSPTDHSGLLWIISLICGIYAVLSLFIRFWIKRACLGLDDWICVLATLVAAGSYGLTYTGLTHGLGKDEWRARPQQWMIVGRLVLASQICFVVALAFSKCSVVLLIRRLFAKDMVFYRTNCNIALVSILIWGLCSTIGLVVHCVSFKIFLDRDQCSGMGLRWELIGIFDFLTEILLIFLSSTLVWRFEMPMGMKLRVVLAFLFRLPLLPIIVLHICSARLASSKPPNAPLTHSTETSFSLSFTFVLICECLELSYSLLSATIPNMRSFIKSFDTAMMMDISRHLEGKHGTNNRQVGHSRSRHLDPRASSSNESMRGGVPSNDEASPKTGGMKSSFQVDDGYIWPGSLDYFHDHTFVIRNKGSNDGARIEFSTHRTASTPPPPPPPLRSPARLKPGSPRVGDLNLRPDLACHATGEYSNYGTNCAVGRSITNPPCKPGPFPYSDASSTASNSMMTSKILPISDISKSGGWCAGSGVEARVNGPEKSESWCGYFGQENEDNGHSNEDGNGSDESLEAIDCRSRQLIPEIPYGYGLSMGPRRTGRGVSRRLHVGQEWV